MSDKKFIESLLLGTDIKINGTNPWDPQIKDERVFDRLFREGSIGLGESYMDGWWDCESLDQFFYKIYDFDLDNKIRNDKKLALKIGWKIVLNTNVKEKAFEIGEKHYDIGNDLYSAMLDKRLTYSCGYWKDARDLDSAQEAKLDLICRKIGLKPEQKVLDIGCGWGSFISFASEKYGAHVTGVTVSKKQKELFDTKYNNNFSEVKLMDYRDIKEKYDHIVSVGMFEHVGYKNYSAFMKLVHSALNDDGIFLLHTIGGNQSSTGSDPWIDKYIFPNSMLPSIAQIGNSIEGLFVMEDWHNFGADYDRTLMNWYKNFENNWDRLRTNYDERFRRMWRYYLLSCAGAFRARRNQLWQIVLSKKGIRGEYRSLR